MVFSGSYLSDDVHFLLKPVRLATISLQEKERLIQSGERHYSEMLSHESVPGTHYWELFERALERNRARLARHILQLASMIADRFEGEITLVSLVRAGTPIGALLKRALQLSGRASKHYSISIIRDRGIDAVALQHILKHHSEASLVFVDGWTGKGAIAEELRTSVETFNQIHQTRLSSGLCTVADLAGVAELSATHEDYLMPNAVLNSVVSGLVSRSVLNDSCVQPGDFHACHFYEEYASHDRSRWFIDEVSHDLRKYANSTTANPTERDSAERRAIADAFECEVKSRYDVSDRNRIKPGIGESTRALLRRVPERLLVADWDAPDVEHLLWLAQSSRVPVEQVTWLPYQATVIIRSLGRN